MRLFLISSLLLLTLAFVGCGDDNNSTGGGTVITTSTSTMWDSTGNNFVTTANATSYDEYTTFSFTGHDTLIPTVAIDDRNFANSHAAAEGWDIAFRREVVKLNGGASTTNSGDVVGVSLGAVDFATVTLADTAGAEWITDDINYIIDSWFTYNFLTHVVTMNQYVWSMVDASGANYVKFRVDSAVGATQTSMGTAYITYFYQTTDSSLDLSGVTSTGVIVTGETGGYFDFSTGSQVTPANPTSSTDWDLKFDNFVIKQNSGPNGPGNCAAFQAFGELTDPTDIDGFAVQPGGAPMFPDIPSSALTDWYTYNPENHQLSSNSAVYLIKTGTSVYKLQISSYYASVGGVPTSANYSFKWVLL